MITLKKLMNVFYPSDKSESSFALNSAVPTKYKSSFENALHTFLAFALGAEATNQIVKGQEESNELTMSLLKSDLGIDERQLTTGFILTRNNDLEARLEIESRHRDIIIFSVYISKINEEHSDIIFKLEMDDDINISEKAITDFILHIVNTLF